MKRAHVVVGFQVFVHIAVHYEFCGLMNFYWHLWHPMTFRQCTRRRTGRWLSVVFRCRAWQPRVRTGPRQFCVDRRGLDGLGFWSNAGPGLASLLPAVTTRNLLLVIADFLCVSGKWLWTHDIVDVTEGVLTPVSKRIARDKLMEVEVPGPTTTWSECICLGLSHFLGDSARSDIW